MIYIIYNNININNKRTESVVCLCQCLSVFLSNSIFNYFNFFFYRFYSCVSSLSLTFFPLLSFFQLIILCQYVSLPLFLCLRLRNFLFFFRFISHFSLALSPSFILSLIVLRFFPLSLFLPFLLLFSLDLSLSIFVSLSVFLCLGLQSFRFFFLSVSHSSLAVSPSFILIVFRSFFLFLLFCYCSSFSSTGFFLTDCYYLNANSYNILYKSAHTSPATDVSPCLPPLNCIRTLIKTL